MKKSLLALCIVSFTPIAALADVVIYGKANLSVQNADEVALDDSRVEVVSNASRIGIKGGEEFNSSLKLIYQFEYQTEVDDGTNGSQTLGQRNIYVGLQSTAGTIMAGHFDTPTKVIQEKVDVFNDLEGDLTHIFKGEIRASNIVQYVTPTFAGGFAASVAYVSEERDGVFSQCPASAGPTCKTTNGTSLSLSYTSPAFYAAIAADKDVEFDGVDLIRAVARFTLGPVQLGVLAEQYEVANTDIDENGVLGSVLWNLSDKWAVKGQYGQSDVKMADGETASVGVDYKMSKSTTFYSYATKVENEIGTRDDTYVGAGIDFKF